MVAAIQHHVTFLSRIRGLKTLRGQGKPACLTANSARSEIPLPSDPECWLSAVVSTVRLVVSKGGQGGRADQPDRVMVSLVGVVMVVVLRRGGLGEQHGSSGRKASNRECAVSEHSVWSRHACPTAPVIA